MSIYGGPFPMGHVPQKCSTNGCESKHAAGENWLRCQGSSPDACLNRLCPNHEQKCEVCGLPACEEHLHTVGGERMCTNCLRDLSAAGDEQVLEALARKIMDEVERDLCPQDEAREWALASAAGLTRYEATLFRTMTKAEVH
jgi:hypothetical protein